MITLQDRPTILADGALLSQEEAQARGIDVDAAHKETLAARILSAHSKPSDRDDLLHVTFDALVSHDITYVGIIQ